MSDFENLPEVPEKKRGILRRMYDWVLSWADTPYGTPALFLIAFAESSFFPIPPDVLQIALSAGRPKRSFFYAGVTLIGSVIGALFGYLIGYAFWESAKGVFIPYVFSQDAFNSVSELYNGNAFVAILIAATTPIPYKVFTIAGGVCHISIPVLIGASIVGRGARFFLIGAILWFFGPGIRRWIEKYFEILAIAFCILLVGGFVLIKFMVSK